MAQNDNGTTEKTPKSKPNYKYQRDKDREPVKGLFHYYEAPGQTLSFVYKAYKEDPVETYHLTDGQSYTLPLGVAKHLNKSGWYPEYGFSSAEAGGATGTRTAYSPDGKTMVVARKIRRYGFQSLEFVDIDDIGVSTPTVEAPPIIV